MANNVTVGGVNTFVDTTVLLTYEASIQDYYRSGQTSWATQVTTGLREIIQDLKKLGKDIKLFSTPYELQAETTVTGATTGTATTNEDAVERMMLVVNTTGDGTWTLKGSNDNVTFNTVTTLTTALDTVTTLNEMFSTPYKYYRLDYSGSGAVYSGYLVSTAFFLAHVYKSLSLVYQSLTSESDDFWLNKAVYYNEKYNQEINNLMADYDTDESGDVDSEETLTKLKDVRFSR